VKQKRKARRGCRENTRKLERRKASEAREEEASLMLGIYEILRS